MSIFKVIAGLVKPIGDIIDNVSTTDEERLELKVKLAEATEKTELALTEYASKLAEARAKIILAEARGSWLQANWRPLLMLSVILIIVNNYIIFPYASIWTDKVKVLELPGGLWALLTAGTTGYVLSRGGEKIATIIQNGHNKLLGKD